MCEAEEGVKPSKPSKLYKPSKPPKFARKQNHTKWNFDNEIVIFLNKVGVSLLTIQTLETLQL